MKVLLADDSDLILERLKEILITFESLDVIATFNNGTIALDAIRSLKPDIAILDIKMPGLSGLEVLGQIRKENCNIKIIILTLYSSEYYRMLADRDGADYFFNKADEFDKVPAAIEDIILRQTEALKLKLLI